MEFIDHDDDLGARRRIGNCHLLAHGKVDVIHDHRAQDSAGIGTDHPCRCVDQQNAAFSEEFAKVDRRPGLRDNAANRRVRRKAVNLGLDWVDHVDLQILIHALKVAAPPFQNVGVFDVILQEAMAKVAQFKEWQNIEERELLLSVRREAFVDVEQGARRHSQRVFHPRSPVVTPDHFADVDEVRNDPIRAASLRHVQQIQPDDLA